MSITTKPNVVKYSTAGVVTLEGAPADVKKKLEANPKTNIPQILFTVYQHVFNSIYILASILNTPYPPPDLLHPMAEKIQILPASPKSESGTGQTATPQASTQPAQPTTTQSAGTVAQTPTASATGSETQPAAPST
ncbi:MAG: hypothetical protein NWF09_04545 [Candidatus Bathyarchaeota archaeon]|nr:hypothetical protein [Candidatus Bathyarchaeota archaeon]